MAKRKAEATRPVSKATTVRKRNRRIAELYELACYRPPEILDILVEEGYFAGVKRDSALRMVQARVAEVREHADVAVIAQQRPAERQRFLSQLAKIMREELFVIDNDDEVERQITTAKGDVLTVFEPRFNADEKQKARKHYIETAERMALVNGVDIKGASIGNDDTLRRDAHPEEPFKIVMTGSNMDALIEANLSGAKVN